MKLLLISGFFFVLSFSLLSAISELNSFHSVSDNGLTILSRTILETEADSVFHQLLPVINGEKYFAVNSSNCEVEISPVMQLRDLEFSVLSVYPAAGIETGDSLQIVLEGSCQEEIELVKSAESFLKMYIALFPELAERENWRDMEPAQPNILYIYPDTNDPSFWDVFDYLLEWKKQKGYKVYEYATNATTCQSIKDYIQQAYNTWEEPPEYICLIGDAGGSFNIPTSYFAGGEGDHYYTTLAGNDQIGDVHIGRLSFNSILQWQTIVYKTIMYEREPYMENPDWFSRALLVGDPTTSGMSCVYTNINIRELIVHNYPEFDFLEIYEAPFQPTMQNMIDLGVTYFNYRGFGGMSGWYDGTADYLHNGMMLPFVVISTCATGDFAGTEGCRSEAFLRAGSLSNPKGAIGAIGTATITTHTCFNNCYVTGVAYGLYAEDLRTMGASHTRGKTSLWLNYPQNPDDSSTKFSCWNNLMGDPAIEVWQGLPRELAIEREEYYSNTMNNVSIRVLNEYSSGAGGLYCCLYNTNNDEQHFCYSDEEGYAVFPTLELESEGYVLTVSGRNFYPEQSDIELETDIELEIEEITFSDNNNNGGFEPGESGELSFYIFNSSSNDIFSIELTVFSYSDGITIENGEMTFEQLNSGEEVLIANIIISYINGTDNISDQLIGVMATSDSCSFTDTYQVPLTFLELTVSDFSITDNNNNEPEPGETIYLDYEITNTGDYDLNGINLELVSNSNLVSVSENSVFIGNLLPEASYQSTESIILEIADEFIAGNTETLRLNFSSSGGFEQVILISFTIGESTVNEPTGPDAFGYCIYDENDTGYMQVEYDWIEINATPELYLPDSGDEGSSYQLALPFNFRYYDQNYDQITICSNGWIAPGYTESASFMNWAIPGEGGISPIIAVFWDDLRNESNSGIYAQYLEDDNVYVVEWDDLRNDWDNSIETFELIIYDREYYPSSNGNNLMKFQYKDFHNTNVGSYVGTHEANHGQYATIGIEDQTGVYGLQYSYNNDYPETGTELNDNSALLIGGEPVPSESAWIIVDDCRYFNMLGEETVTPGDTIAVILDLWNIGNEMTEMIFIALTCENEENIEIMTDEILTSGIEAGALSEGIAGLSFFLSETFPPLEMLEFNLEIISSNMRWNYRSIKEVTAPLLDFSEDEIDFGEVMCNYEAEYVLGLKNSGTAPLEITEIFTSCSQLSTNFAPVIVEPGESVDLILTYLGVETGPFSEFLTIISNSITSDTVNLPVTGLVVSAPEIQVDSSTQYIDAEEDELTNYIIEINNIGEGTLSISAHLEGFYNSWYGALFSGGYLSLSEPVITGTEFTIEAWARIDGPGFHLAESNTIYEQRDDEPEDYRAIMVFFARSSSGYTVFTIQGATSTGVLLVTPAPPFGEWHHYAATVDNDFINLYIDGQLMVTEYNCETGGHTQGVTNIDLGAHRYNNTLKASLNGMLDEVRFWDRAMSPEEILEYQYHSVSQNSEGLTAYWTFNQTNNWNDLVNNDIIVTPHLEVNHTLSEAPINDWSNLDTSALTISGGDSDAITLQIDASWLQLGNQYETNLILETNDPEAENIVIPIVVSVMPSSEDENEIALQNTMRQNYPNPFNSDADDRSATIIEYALCEDVLDAEIIIYNIKGQKVKEFVINPETDRHGQISWDGCNTQNKIVGSGVYCYILKTNGAVNCQKKMLLLH